MKNVLYLLLLVGSVLVLNSCGDEENPQRNGTLTFNFKAEYSGQPLVMLEEYTLPSGLTMNFSRISFYLSDLALLGSTTEYDNVDYVNLTNAHSNTSSAIQGFNYSKSVPVGEYTGVNFSFGVNASNNAMVPADFNSDSDLSLSQEYWPGWESYVFVKVEGNADLDNDGTLEQGVALHIGGPEALRIINASKDFTISEGQSTTLNFVIDLNQMLTSGGIYDVEANPQIHSLGQADIVKDLADRFADALSFQ